MAKAKKPASGAKAPTTSSVLKTAAAKSASTVTKVTKEAVSKTTAEVKKAETPIDSATPEKPVSKTAPAMTADAKTVSDKSTDAAAPAKPADAPKVSESTAQKDVKEPKTESKPQATPAPVSNTKPNVQKAEERGSVFWPLVLGGVVAGVIGFLASEMDLIGSRQSNDDLRNRLVAQQGQLAEQKEQIAALQSATPAPAEIEMPDLSGINAELVALQERLSVIEDRPIVVPSDDDGAAAAAYAAELAALKASVETQKSEIQSLLDTAKSVEEATASMAQQAEMRAALTEITAALNKAAPYSDALAGLQASGIEDVPAALTDSAGGGVVTLINLQTRFADAARAALAVARTSGDQAGEGGLGGFLKRQLGARSVAPREGSDPDAVLSRVGAALRDGQLAEALDEVNTLPQDVQAAMGDWLSDARTRAAAEAAAQDLSQRLTAN